MNDHFLYRLRKEPPPAFAARLKARLAQEPAQKAGFSIVRSLVLGLLVGGSAIAATWWAVHGTPSNERHAIVAQTKEPTSRTARQTRSGSSGQQRSPLESASLKEAPDTEQARTSASATSISNPNAPVDAASTPEPSRGGVIGGFASQTSGKKGDSTDFGQRWFIRAAGHEHGMLLVEAVRRRTANALFRFEVERVEDGEAFRRLCAREQGVDLIITTRSMSDEEMRRCMDNFFRQITAKKLGHIAVVISAAKTATALRLSPREIYLALAKRIPDPANPARFISNPNVSWHQVHSGHQERRITFFGPERDSPLAHVFAALILKAGCDTFPSIKGLSETDPEQYHRICHEIREDAVYTPVHEGEFFLTQTLWGDPNALAVLSMPFYDAHRTQLSGSVLFGAVPTMESIAAEAYEGAVTLYVYAQDERTISKWFIDELVSERAIGPSGYLISQALIPLDARDSTSASRESVR